MQICSITERSAGLLLLNFRSAYLLGLGLTMIVVVLALPSGLTGLWAGHHIFALSTPPPWSEEGPYSTGY